jgi:hypothetical protein
MRRLGLANLALCDRHCAKKSADQATENIGGDSGIGTLATTRATNNLGARVGFWYGLEAFRRMERSIRDQSRALWPLVRENLIVARRVDDKDLSVS